MIKGGSLGPRAELANALAWWNETMARSGRSVKRLLEDDHWRLLTGSLQHSFTGKTAAALTAGREAAERVQTDQRTLEDLFIKVRRLQANGWASAKLTNQAIYLLYGASIPSDPPAELPLHEQGLLGEAKEPTGQTPKAVLDRMQADFATAAGALASIHKAWSEVRQSGDQLQAEIDDVAKQGADPAEVAELRASAVAITEAALADTLADHREPISDLAARLDELRRRVAMAPSAAALGAEVGT